MQAESHRDRGDVHGLVTARIQLTPVYALPRTAFDEWDLRERRVDGANRAICGSLLSVLKLYGTLVSFA